MEAGGKKIQFLEEKKDLKTDITYGRNISIFLTVGKWEN